MRPSMLLIGACSCVLIAPVLIAPVLKVYAAEKIGLVNVMTEAIIEKLIRKPFKYWMTRKKLHFLEAVL